MIPALLSCVFVAYLYFSLNASSSDATSAINADSNPSERFKALETRLQRILEKTQK